MSIATTRPTTPAPARSAARSRLLGYRDRLTYTGTVHLLADLALGTAYFTVLITLLALSAALAVTVVGVPLLALTLLVARCVGHLERARARVLLDVTVPSPARRRTSFWRRLVDSPDWRACIYGLALLPTGLVTGGLTLIGWSSAAAAAGFPLYAPTLDDPALHLGPVDVDGLAADIGSVALGLAVLAVMPRLVGALAIVDRWLTRSLLGA